MKIIFFGTPEFASAVLKKLVEEKYTVTAVVTSPDKPSGRGLHLHESAVKKYAIDNNIPVLQPLNLKNEDFLEKIKSFNADVFVVVAFRMMPEVLWKIPRKGAFNLHASLLPQYRGAAPINHAIINGETETGLTTFFISQHIDTGDIILQKKIKIEENENAGHLHDRMKKEGADLVIETLKQIEDGTINAVNQSNLVTNSNLIKAAPKIFKDYCRINWSKSVDSVCNHIRGLSPYPGAFTELLSLENKTIILKIFSAGKEYSGEAMPGIIFSDNKSFLKISCTNGSVSVKELQFEGKKRMRIEEFLRGIKINNYTVKK